MKAENQQRIGTAFSLVSTFGCAAAILLSGSGSAHPVSGYPFDFDTESKKSVTEQAADWVAYHEPELENLSHADLDPASVKNLNFNTNTLKGIFTMSSPDGRTVVLTEATCVKAADVLVCNVSNSLPLYRV